MEEVGVMCMMKVEEEGMRWCMRQRSESSKHDTKLLHYVKTSECSSFRCVGACDRELFQQYQNALHHLNCKKVLLSANESNTVKHSLAVRHSLPIL